MISPHFDVPYAALPARERPFDWTRSDGDLEVDAMIFLPDGGCEPGEPADFYSVFAHFVEGGRECLSDHMSLKGAERAVRRYRRDLALGT